MNKVSHGIPQLKFGSFSGRSNYRILAQPSDIPSKITNVVEIHSYLGGSAIQTHKTAEIIAFYPVSNSTWAFSKTFFVGRNRGNDYVVHILLLDIPFLKKIRGNIFLLEKLMDSKKPILEIELPLLKVNPGILENGSKQSINHTFTGDWDQNYYAKLLAKLMQNSIAINVSDMAAGLKICKTLFLLLPPEDRIQFAFCTYFSYEQELSYNFTTYNKSNKYDYDLVSQKLKLFGDKESIVSEVQSVTPEQLQASVNWCKLIKSGLEPVSGISILRRPQSDIQIAYYLMRCALWAKNPSEKPNPIDEARNHGVADRLVFLSLHPENKTLKQIGVLYKISVFEKITKKINTIWNGDGDPLKIASAIHKIISDYDTDGTLAEHLVRLSQTVYRDQKGIVNQTAGICIALFGHDSALMHCIYSDTSDALWTTPKSVVRDLRIWFHEDRHICTNIMLILFLEWSKSISETIQAREQDLPHPSLYDFCRILDVLDGNYIANHDSDFAKSLLKSMEETAPQLNKDPKARKDWFLYFYRWINTNNPMLLTPIWAARWIAGEQLLAEMESTEISYTTWQALLREFSKNLLNIFVLEPGKFPTHHIPALVQICAKGLLGRNLGGFGWDLGTFPRAWDLAAHIAENSSLLYINRQFPIPEEHQLVGKELVWLLFAASTLLSHEYGYITKMQSEIRFARVLNALILHPPQGFCDILIITFVRFYRFFKSYKWVFTRKDWKRLCEYAIKDSSRNSELKNYRKSILFRIAILNKKLEFRNEKMERKRFSNE